jgi:hypothetical protein
MSDLTDAELLSAIVYMLIPQDPKANSQPFTPPSMSSANRKVVDDVEVFPGVVPAEALRQRLRQVAEAVPEGIPNGEGYHYLNISLFDAKTRAAISDAEVEVRVLDPLSGGETRKLQLEAVNNVKSYAGYFRMASQSPYRISAQIRRPGSARFSRADFEYERN